MYLYLSLGPGKRYAIPVSPDKSLTDLPLDGITSDADLAKLNARLVINRDSVSPGSDPSTYVFTKTDVQRNLSKILMH